MYGNSIIGAPAGGGMHGGGAGGGFHGGGAGTGMRGGFGGGGFGGGGMHMPRPGGGFGGGFHRGGGFRRHGGFGFRGLGYPGYAAFWGYPGYFSVGCQAAYAAWQDAVAAGADPGVTEPLKRRFEQCLYTQAASNLYGYGYGGFGGYGYPFPFGAEGVVVGATGGLGPDLANGSLNASLAATFRNQLALAQQRGDTAETDRISKILTSHGADATPRASQLPAHVPGSVKHTSRGHAVPLAGPPGGARAAADALQRAATAEALNRRLHGARVIVHQR